MTLKEFTENSLVEIVDGIIGANDKLKAKGAFVACTDVRDYCGNSSNPMIAAIDNEGHEHLVTNVEFDVLVNVVDGNSKEANGGAMLSVFSIGAKKNSSSQNELASRVRYSVPLALPVIE